MRPTHPLPLHHSWPLADDATRLDLGLVWDTAPIGAGAIDRLPGIGRWSCRLEDAALTWSGGVFDLFGLPRDAAPSRAETVALYAEPSRAAMERLRAHAIRHRRGFTLDVEIRPGGTGRRWIRLIAAPAIEAGVVTRLQGLKLDVSGLYRGGSAGTFTPSC